MIANYIKIALRNLRRNKAFSIINIAGLSLSMASILSLALLVNQYYARDEFHLNKDRMYYLKTFSSDGSDYLQTTFPLLYEIKATCPEVEIVTHWQGWNNPWLSFGENETQENTAYVDSGFLEMFSFNLLEGDLKNAIRDNQSLIISKRVKTLLFGDKSALGETVIVGDSIPRTITGVVEIPANSSLQAEVFLPVQFLKDYTGGFDGVANWYNTFAPGYLLVKEGTDIDLLNAKINNIVQKNYTSPIQGSTVKAVPFTELKTELGETVHKIIIGAVAAAIFVLLIVVVNLVNLNMVKTFTRAKEIAVRRVVGSLRRHIVTQFCIENGLIMIISLILGLIIFQILLLPMVNNVVGDRLGTISLEQGYAMAALCFGFAIAIVFIAAVIPAMRLIRLKLNEAIKGKNSEIADRNEIRNTLITTQFVLGITFLCMAFILNKQIKFMKSASLGFNTEDVMVGALDLGFVNPEQANSRFEVILQSLKAEPYVKAVSTTQEIPTAYINNYNLFVDIENDKEVRMQFTTTDAGFIETYEIPLVVGRNFDDRMEATEGDKVLINETAAKAFGWSDPIGKKIKGYGGDQVVTVIGVMKDFHYKSLDQPIGPLMHWYGGKSKLGYNSAISVRYDSGKEDQTISKLEGLFREISSKKDFSHRLMSDMVKNQYILIDGILKVTNYVALLILVIACMGLLGLSMMFAQQRTKEVGIRKVLGASIAGIVLLLSKGYLKLVAMAIIIAAPIAWWVMSKWLEDYAYRIEIQWWMFLLAGLVAIMIALFTVGWHALRTAVMNPVKSLREE